MLELTDRKMRHFEMGAMMTVVCAVAAPPYERFEICLAGHPPPVRVVPGNPAALVDVPVGPPLGALDGISRSAGTVDLPPGAVLLLYTDGLIERRGESIDDGLSRLRKATPAEHPDTVCRAVMHDLVGHYVPTDDIALLAMRRCPETGVPDHR